MKTIDLRSDTVTLPTKEMIDSISSAGLGDDVEREDPTVNKLQDMAANMFGAEDALLVPSGTGGNLIAMLAHCQRGDEIILEQDAHMYYYEVGGMSALVGAIPQAHARAITGFSPATRSARRSAVPTRCTILHRNWWRSRTPITAPAGASGRLIRSRTWPMPPTNWA